MKTSRRNGRFIASKLLMIMALLCLFLQEASAQICVTIPVRPPGLSINGSSGYMVQHRSNVATIVNLPIDQYYSVCSSKYSYEAQVDSGHGVVGDLILWPGTCMDVESGHIVIQYVCRQPGTVCQQRQILPNPLYHCKGSNEIHYGPPYWVTGGYLPRDRFPLNPLRRHFVADPGNARIYIAVTDNIHIYEICSGGLPMQGATGLNADGSKVYSTFSLKGGECTRVGGRSFWLDTQGWRAPNGGTYQLIQ